MSLRNLWNLIIFVVMFLSGIGQGIQDRLQGILSKINRERLRNRVTDWQKKLVATASSKFSFDSTAPEVLEEPLGVVEPGSSSYQENPGPEQKPPWDELTESDPGKRPDTLREGIMEGEVGLEKKLLTPVTEEPPRNKSPVQQWVDSLIDEHDRRDEDMPPIAEADQNDAEVESFTLGAEAPGVVCPRPYPFVQVTAHCSGSDAGSHCSSMESLLEARKPDPEEMLLELGFGGCEEPDIISRIPDRFLRPSSMKGVAIDDFIKHQQMMVHQFQSGFSGYRGLTGPSHAMPSGIVGKIMDRLLEAEVGRQNLEAYYRQQQQALIMNAAVQHCQASQTQGGYSPKLARLAHNLMIKMKGTKKELSVLSPENRNWYESQGDKSPEPAGRRIIIGHHSYTFAKDGNLMEESKGTVVRDKVVENLVGPVSKPGGDKEPQTSNGNNIETDTMSLEENTENVTQTANPANKVSRVLFEVEEEEEEDVSLSISLRTESAMTDTRPSSGNWPSSVSVCESLADKSSTPTDRRGSLQDSARPSIEKRRASLLEGRRLHEERRGSLDVDRCSSCGSRKSSLTESHEPALKRSKSPAPRTELEVLSDLLEQSLVEGETRVRKMKSEYSNETEDSTTSQVEADMLSAVCSPVRKRPSLTESEMQWMSLSLDEYLPPISDAPKDGTPSLMVEMNLTPSIELSSSESFERAPEGNEVPSSVHLGRRRSSDASCGRSHSEDKLSVAGSSSPSTPSSHSFDQEEAEVEFKNLNLLLTQLQDSVTSIDIGSEEEFLALNPKGRRHLQVAVIEEALRTYQKRLKELDLRGHLRDLLTGQLHRVTDLLDASTAPSVLTIMKQMTTLLRHQEALRQELDSHEGEIGNQPNRSS
ncbi:hypothetical protein GE061_003580 [Apolygus lucorum]|uniref:ITPR-interacting domain-containing protein n=1 Tax=Apolygus lucorum TaxID=248454 RepID=A0A8S9X2J1_APOLU|nr:hypothetical protein GE061_003580 [Apolygus lucorum]